ncbi:MAG: TIM barrel protein [Actinomycetaceae bacterium]|nr:TIM barrel protein [Actinomycetaceae bacterium]
MKYAVNCSILFKELPLFERVQAAKESGFEAVEYWWPFDTAEPAEKDVDTFVDAINDSGVQLIGLNFFAGDMPAGDRGLVSWVEREAEFKANVPVVMEIGKRTGCRAFNALYGNRQKGVDIAQQDEIGAQNLAFAAKAAAEIEGVVLLEPVSGSPDYPLKKAAEVIAVMDRVKDDYGVSNIGFLADLYHLAANGDDVDKVIELYTARAAHCQIADSPGRGEPGTGDLPLKKYLDQMKARGYDNWVALEYNPTVETAQSFTHLPELL